MEKEEPIKVCFLLVKARGDGGQDPGVRSPNGEEFFE